MRKFSQTSATQSSPADTLTSGNAFGSGTSCAAGSRESLAGPGKQGAKVFSEFLAQLNQHRERLEASLAAEIPELNLERRLRAVDATTVARRLPERSSLVEFVRYFPVDFEASVRTSRRAVNPARYAAFVMTAGRPEAVNLIDIGEADHIDQLIAEFRAEIMGEMTGGMRRDIVARPHVEEHESRRSTRNPGDSLRVILYDRFESATAGTKHILIAPDGNLARLPFGVLPRTNGRRLIDDYQISYLSCGREVLRFGAASTGQPSQSIVVADPDFDLTQAGWSESLLDPDKNAGPSKRPVPTPSSPAPRALQRHSRELDGDRSAYHFDRLPGTRSEGERVANLLDVSPWFDATAMEGRLKIACRSPRILHLATHGFFLPDQERDLDRGGRGPEFDFGAALSSGNSLTRLTDPMLENPMLRSGLALAGANTWLKGETPPESAEDGLLTAEDVSGLDLLSTELVVLSACDTGLGMIQIGEGVFGLRRAFVLAGAKTLVISLWKVPDEQTQALMVAFYQGLLAGAGRAEAMREAQLAIKARYTDPYYWGAFICQGDPAPLEHLSPSPAAS